MRDGTRSGQRRPGDTWPLDASLALLAAVVNIVGALGTDAATAYEYADGGALHVGLAAGGGAVLWWRRDRPVATFAASTTVIALVVALEWQPGAMPLAWLTAAYALGAHAPLRSGVWGIAFALVVGLALVALQAPFFDSLLALGTLGQLLLVWLLGCVVDKRRQTAEAARHRALLTARRAGSAAEQAASAERRRLARELHDSVTNSLSVVTVQAAAIRRELSGALDGPLETIEESSRAALVDLRRMLGALRSSDDLEVEPTSDLRESLARSTGWTPASPPEERSRTLLARDWPVDLALGLGVAAINVTGSLVPDTSTTIVYREPVTPVLVLLAAAPGLALVVRRRHALAALATALMSLLTIVALGWQTGNIPATVLIGSFAVAAWSPIRHCALGLAAVLAVMTTIGQIDGRQLDDAPFPWMVVLLLLLAPWVVGGLVRQRRATADCEDQRGPGVRAGLSPTAPAVALRLTGFRAFQRTCPVAAVGPGPAGATGLIRSLTTR